MSQGDWQLAQGDALTRFLVSAAKAERFAEFYTGETDDPAREVGPDAVSFCRHLFLQTHARRHVDPAQALPCREAVAGVDNTLSFSGFRPQAYHLQRWLRVDLFAPHRGTFAFRVAACGGVRIWKGGELLACFTPFTRNRLQYTDVSLRLNAGRNSLLIHLDELFERETNFALEMIYLDEPTLGASLPEACPPIAPPAVCEPAQDDSARRLLTLMARREYGPELDALLLRTLKRVSAREEGSVFALLALLSLWHRHQGEYFPEVLWRRVKSTALGYRYWHDERGCDVMAFWGEENTLAFQTAQYLAGQLFPEGLFIASGRRGQQQQRLALTRAADARALRAQAEAYLTGEKA
ncbi:hypothetical protein [Leclercia tamurae]|uniref:Uncharacterized protein n=1 Tax=Leclercia tamurae TaxID=2926467 RepID=A0ABT2R7K6_9ENTR|nr:hypothetical protein [Leclercia tamurae]MCU6676862.1 hypothetical protein [Leclercia tamurae]